MNLHQTKTKKQNKGVVDCHQQQHHQILCIIFLARENRQNKSIYNGFFCFKCVNNIIELIDRWKHHSTTASKKHWKWYSIFSAHFLSFQQRIPERKKTPVIPVKPAFFLAPQKNICWWQNWQFSTWNKQKDYHHYHHHY